MDENAVRNVYNMVLKFFSDGIGLYHIGRYSSYLSKQK